MRGALFYDLLWHWSQLVTTSRFTAGWIVRRPDDPPCGETTFRGAPSVQRRYTSSGWRPFEKPSDVSLTTHYTSLNRAAPDNCTMTNVFDTRSLGFPDLNFSYQPSSKFQCLANLARLHLFSFSINIHLSKTKLLFSFIYVFHLIHLILKRMLNMC